MVITSDIDDAIRAFADDGMANTQKWPICAGGARPLALGSRAESALGRSFPAYVKACDYSLVLTDSRRGPGAAHGRIDAPRSSHRR
jgi:hypothetical protein